MRQKILYDTRILEATKDHKAPLKFFEPPPKGAIPGDELGEFVLNAIGLSLSHIDPFDDTFNVSADRADLHVATLQVKNSEGVIRFAAPLEVIGLDGKLFPIEPQGLRGLSVEIVFDGFYHSCTATKIRVYLSCLLPD